MTAILHQLRLYNTLIVKYIVAFIWHFLPDFGLYNTLIVKYIVDGWEKRKGFVMVYITH